MLLNGLTWVRARVAGLRTLPFLLVWALAWLVQWWLAPTWLVGSRSGLQTALQVLPAVVVGILVLVLGSLFVLAQQAVASHGTRAPLVMPFNPRIRGLITRPLAVAVIAVLLSGQIPDAGDPPAALTAAVATLVLATVAVLSHSAASLQAVFPEVTAPVVFTQQVLSGVQEMLERGETGLVVFRAGLLTEMLGQSVARGDSRGITASLQGLDAFHEAYITAADKNPGARRHRYNDGREVDGWMAHEVPDGLVAAAQDGLNQARASEDDMDGMLDTIERFGSRAIRAGHHEESTAAIDALGKIATCVQQVQPSGAVNHPTRVLTNLAQLEGVAETHGARPEAARALATMMLVLTYVQRFPLGQHPTFRRAVELLGDRPPFDDAADLLESREWVDRWANKLPPPPHAILGPLGFLQQTITEHANQHGAPSS